MANKVEFGISQLHIGTYTAAADGTVMLGTPYHLPGARSFSTEAQSEQNNYYADNVIYWSGYSGGSLEGDLAVALFTDEFKKQFLGYKETVDGGLGEIKGAFKPNIYIAFQVDDGERSKSLVNLDELTQVADDNLAVDEVQTAFDGVGQLLMKSIIDSPFDGGFAFE